MSIVTKRGDGGQTDLIGSIRTSKSSRRVNCYGTVDELISQLGFARSISEDAETRDFLKQLQQALFGVAASIATPPESKIEASELGPEVLEVVEQKILQIEAIDGLLNDWALPGETPEAASLDVARTICRRAEREAVGLRDADLEVNPNVIAYLNRLSDLLWLLARVAAHRAGADIGLRDHDHPGKPWSRAW